MSSVPTTPLATIQRPGGTTSIRIALGWSKSRHAVTIELWSTRTGTGEPYSIHDHRIMLWGSELPQVIAALQEAQAKIES